MSDSTMKKGIVLFLWSEEASNEDLENKIRTTLLKDPEYTKYRSVINTVEFFNEPIVYWTGDIIDNKDRKDISCGM